MFAITAIAIGTILPLACVTTVPVAIIDEGGHQRAIVIGAVEGRGRAHQPFALVRRAVVALAAAASAGLSVALLHRSSSV